MLERYCLFFMEFEERESITIETSRISLVYREGDDEKKKFMDIPTHRLGARWNFSTGYKQLYPLSTREAARCYRQ